jgi:hypothetical protein
MVASALPPLAVGLFGLGVGYFVWGGHALTGWPKDKKPGFDQTMGLWGMWLPGFCQFITGVWLFTGLTIFNAFQGSPFLYMAALAFTVFGIHWFVMGGRRFLSADPRPDAFMAIAFLWLSITGAYVFFNVPDIPVAIVFVLLTAIYASEAVARFSGSQLWERIVAAFQVTNGVWLMYLTFAFAVDFAINGHFWN